MAMNESAFAALLLADYLPKLNITGLGSAAATAQAKDLCDSIATVIGYIQANAEVATATTSTVTVTSVSGVTTGAGVSGSGAGTATGTGTGTVA